MPLFGKIVVIKRNGTDGTHFPLTANSCLFGRKKECDIRIQMPQVSKEHCKIEINENKEAVLFNLSSTNPTQLNGNQFQDPKHLNHGDVLTIIDRSFRFEYPPHPLPQKRLSRSQEKETLQILHVQHMQQVELLHPQNSDYKSSPITGKKLEIHPLSSNEKRTQEQYSTPEFKYKMHNTEETNEMSPFSKLYELMKHEGGTDNIKEDTGNETLLEDVLHSTSRRSSVSQAKLTKGEHSEDSKIQEKGGIIANPVPILFEEKNSEKSSSIQSCGMKQKQECDGTNQSDVKDIEYNEVGKSQIIKSASNYACFKTNRQNAQHFPESCCIVSLDYTEKARCLNKINLTDAFTSVENILPKPKSSRDCTQSYSSPCSKNSRRSSKSRRSWVEMDSLNRTKSSGEMEEHSVQISTEQPESDVLIENVYSKTNENRELVTETTQNLKDSEDGNSSTVFSSLHFNTSKNCNSSIELNKNVSKEYSCVEAIGTDKSVIIPADPSQTSGIMANQIPEKNLGTGCPTNENKIKISIEGHEQNVNMKNNIPAFSSSYESNVRISAKDDAVFEMNLSSPLKVIKKSEAKKSQKRKGTELDLLVQPFGKRKRVSFGGQLSPELFDKRLPPNSPLKKGAIPARLSMPFGNSPRAVLKKTSELRQALIKGSSERKQQENTVPKQAASHSVLQRQECFFVPHVASQSSKDEKATAQEMHVNRLSTEVKKTECDEPESKALPSLRRSKPNTPRRSSMLGKGGAMDEEVTAQEMHVNSLFTEVKKTECDEPESKAASSLRRSNPNTPRRSSILGKGGAMDEEVTAQEMHVNSLFTEVKKTECDEPKSKAASSLRRSNPNTPRRSSVLGKSGAMDAIRSKIRSGASKANLIVAKSWAEVVKQGVPKLQLKSASKQGFKRSAKKMPSKSSKNTNLLKTPERKISGHFTTGHANSPAPVVIGKAHTGIVNITAQIPKVVINYPLKQHYDFSESFTGLAEMFHTPPTGKEKSFVPETLTSKPEIMSEMNASEDYEKKSVLDFNISSQKTHYNQDVTSPVLEEVSQISIPDQGNLKMTNGETSIKKYIEEENLLVSLNERNIMGIEEENLQQESEPVKLLLGVKRLLKTPEQNLESVEAFSGVKTLLRTSEKKSGPVEVISGVKRLLRTPKQKSEPVEALSGVKRLLRTPKQKSEPVEALSGVKRLLKTPKQKSEPVEALSGVKRLLRTPKQKSEPVEALSGVKRLLKTPKQKSEPVEALSGVKRLLRTPKQKSEPVEALSGVKRLLKTPKQKSEPVEALSGVKRLLRTPKQKSEPVEALSGVKRLLKTPKQKSEPVEALSGVKRLLRTPKQKSEPVEALSGVKRLLKTPKQKSEPVEALSGVKRLLRTPKQKSEPVEALSGVKRLLRTPKQKSEPVEALSGVKRLLRTPKQKYEPVEALSGVKRILKTPKQKSEPVEVLSGIKTILKTPKQNMDVDDVYTKSVVSTEEVLANMVGSVTKKKTKQRMHPMEDTNINNITEEFKETVKPIEDGESIQLMTQKQRFEHINNVVGICQRLKTSKPKSMPTDDYLELQKFMTESKESSISPAIDYTGVKEMLDTENEHNAELPESVNLMEENGSYITSRNQLESVENVSGSCKVKLEVTFERESHFPVTKNNSSSVPKHVGHVACNSFNELKTEFNEETTRAVYLSESYKPDGMSSKNEAKTDFVKEAAANPDALDTEKLESLPLVRTRRRKINDRSCAIYTKKIQRPTKNTRRPRSANCEQTSESFDNQTELNPMDKSESNFTTTETKTKQSQRGRPKKLPVKTNGNIGPGNISHTQQLQKPSKETTVEEQSVNRKKVATKRNGKIEANMDLEENGPTPENEGDLTAKIWLRSRNVKKSASDLNTKFDEGKTNNALSGEESIKRNRRGKNAVIQSNPETLITTFNEHKQGRKKYTVSKIIKTETSANNLTVTKENLVRKGKGKNVHFLLKSDFKVSEEKCVLRYEDNAPEEEESAFLESSVSPKENTSQSCKRKAVPVETQLICMSYFKEKRTLENCRDSHKQDIHVSFKNVTPETNLPAFNSSFVQEKSMLEIQTESISTEIPKVPLESMQTPAEHNPVRREKLAKKYLPSRGRGKKTISSPSIESDSKSAFDVKEENQPKRGRGRKMVQMLPKPIPLENTAFGEEDSTINSFPSAQGGYSLPQIQDETVKEAEEKPLENVQILEKYIPPKRVVKENPPRRGRSKQVNKISSNEAADVQDPNMVINQEDNQSRRGRRKRSAPESSSLKSQRTVKENPPRQGRHKQTMSGEISAHCDSTEITAIKDQNIVGKNACPAKENQSKMSGRRKITLVFQKTLSPVKNDTFHLLSPNKGKHSDEQPTEGLKTANNANENLSHKCRRRKADDEISASSVSSCKIAKLIDNDIQENRTKDLEHVAKQNISRRSKRKQLTPYGTATERIDELRINSKKTEPVTDKVDPLENSFEKKHQSKKQREETTIASLVSPSLKVSITLSPLSSADENQSGNRKDSIEKGKLAKHSGTYNIMTRSVRGKGMVQKEEFFHEKENKDYKQKTAMASENNQRRGRRKIKLEAAVSPSLKEKCILPTGSDIVPNDQIMILNNVSNKKVSLMGKGQNILKMKTMTQNTNQGNSSNYDQNKNVEHSNMLVQKSSSKRGKRKINSNSETNVSPDTMKNVFPENKSTISKAENTGSVTVQTRGKKKMKEENTTLVTKLPGETEGRTRASKRIRK
ncbi:proliferation marker protein Ki-67 isoform X1 [Python bivittatus]|uniref:Proliferation marker protein Ki-67 isoform X1 n=1 Tax=Python bivittatus TaxID=176946 RepID=A0A9F5J2Y3_PYTBI|nr:proliferation marker protein Ki-67 isoform X1 [Python bivittatus]